MRVTRRRILSSAAVGFAAATIVPRHALGGPKFFPPSEKRKKLTGDQGEGILTRCPRFVVFLGPPVRKAGRIPRCTQVDSDSNGLESRCANDLPLIFSGV